MGTQVAVDQTTGTVRLRAEFPNRDLQLWPGQFVNVRLLIDTLRQVVVVPTAAIAPVVTALLELRRLGGCLRSRGLVGECQRRCREQAGRDGDGDHRGHPGAPARAPRLGFVENPESDIVESIHDPGSYSSVAGRDEQRLGAQRDHAVVVAERRARETGAAFVDRGLRVEADPLAARLATEVHGQLAVDEQPLVP